MTRDAAFAVGLHVLLLVAISACLLAMRAPEGGLAAAGMLCAWQLGRLYALHRDMPDWLRRQLAETIENPREPTGGANRDMRDCVAAYIAAAAREWPEAPIRWSREEADGEPIDVITVGLGFEWFDNATQVVEREGAIHERVERESPGAVGCVAIAYEVAAENPREPGGLTGGP